MFCFFSLISNEYQKLAVSETKLTLRKSDSNKYIASKILNYFGLFESKSERDNSPEIMLNNFTVGITGAFPVKFICISFYFQNNHLVLVCLLCFEYQPNHTIHPIHPYYLYSQLFHMYYIIFLL